VVGGVDARSGRARVQRRGLASPEFHRGAADRIRTIAGQKRRTTNSPVLIPTRASIGMPPSATSFAE